MSILPSILEVANEYQVEINPRSYSKKEIEAKCPFCKSDSGKKGEYKLSLNQVDNVFQCWHSACKASGKGGGGVIRFEALLSGMSYEQVKLKYRERARFEKEARGEKTNKSSYVHPATKLTPIQLKLIGYDRPISWWKLKQRDYDYFKRTANLVFTEWREYVKSQRYFCFQALCIGILTNDLQRGIELIREKEKELDTEFVGEMLQLYSLPRWPDWAIQAESFAKALVQAGKQPKQTFHELVELNHREAIS